MQIELAIHWGKQKQVTEHQGIIAEVGIGYGSFRGCHHFPTQPAGGPSRDVSLRLYIVEPAYRNHFPAQKHLCEPEKPSSRQLGL